MGDAVGQPGPGPGIQPSSGVGAVAHLGLGAVEAAEGVAALGSTPRAMFMSVNTLPA
jgi:hypothetical protein